MNKLEEHTVIKYFKHIIWYIDLFDIDISIIDKREIPTWLLAKNRSWYKYVFTLKHDAGENYIKIVSVLCNWIIINYKVTYVTVLK